MLMVEVPSRTKVKTYQALKNNVDELVGYINGEYGIIGWMPVWYMYRFFPFNKLTALYSIADVALVTPIRDGMNLIAKEFVATKRNKKGVLILSEVAGASQELSEAIIVNPNNKEELETALKNAFSMSEKEQKERNKAMQKRLKRYDIYTWAKDFMGKFEKVIKEKKELGSNLITGDIRDILVADYRKSRKRLLFMDYDGTLVSFKDKPSDAKPDEVIDLIRRLSKKEENEVVIISGRDKDTLKRWFKGLDIGIIAEHGVWIKERMKRWRTIEQLKGDWKKEIRPLLEYYVDRTPGTFIEEKDYSLVWHYRKANPTLGNVRSNELQHELLQFTVSYNLGVLQGNKVIEIKNGGINKGRAALQWIPKKKWDFILAIGDDVTDEDTFDALPENAYSIKVGLGLTHAKYNMESIKEVRSLIKEFLE